MRYSLTTDLNNWMSAIDDDKSLASISIPGTHNSCASIGASGQAPGIDAFVATQYSYSIAKQLSHGIRYLDIRCCAIDGVFTIHHDKFYLNINFGDVLNQCVAFLEKNPSETILMRIKQENSSVSDSEFLNIFNNKYKPYQSKMYLGSSVPKLKEVRGKIVIIANVSSLPGISYSSMKVQDDYTETNVSSKLAKIIQHMNESIRANRNNNRSVLYLNHCNATNPPWVSPKSFAGVLVPSLERKLKEGQDMGDIDVQANEAPHIGVFILDFYTDTIVREIIKRNENKDLHNLKVYSMGNRVYGNHYFYASLYMDNPMKRRQVFCWAQGNKVSNGYWVFIPVEGVENQYMIFNTYYKEFLYASTFIEDNRRTVFTWIDGVPTLESTWTIQGKTIYNEYYKCYLYESSLSFTENRKLVPCWAPGNLVNQAFWELVAEGQCIK